MTVCTNTVASLQKGLLTHQSTLRIHSGWHSPVAPAHRGVSRRALVLHKSPSGLAAKVPTRVGQLGVARAPEAAAAPTTSPGPRDLGRRPGTLVVDLGGAQRGLDGHSTT